MLLPQRLTEVTGPLLGDELITMADADLTTQHAGEPQGQRIIVSGQVRDSGGRPVPDTLVEIWQTNAAGRYRHAREHHPAPLDPNFGGTGRAITDSGGRYRFITIAAGLLPVGQPLQRLAARAHPLQPVRPRVHPAAGHPDVLPRRPAAAYDPIYNSVTDEAARARMVAEFSLDDTQPEWALGYRFDIVLRGPRQCVFEEAHP